MVSFLWQYDNRSCRIHALFPALPSPRAAPIPITLASGHVCRVEPGRTGIRYQEARMATLFLDVGKYSTRLRSLMEYFPTLGDEGMELGQQRLV